MDPKWNWEIVAIGWRMEPKKRVMNLDETENLGEKKKGSNKGGPPNGTMKLMQLGDMKGRRHQ